jgi:hypothetical protein
LLCSGRAGLAIRWFPSILKVVRIIQPETLCVGPKSGGWGYALFNYEVASDEFTADPSPSDCGHACHVAVKAKDHIFHPYQKR